MFHVKHFKKQIKRLVKKAHIKVDEDEIEKFLLYYQELARWNEHINLISASDLPDFPQKYLYPAFILSRYLKGDKFILDYGAGGGVVGVPLSIILKGAKIYLLESRIKRCVFLKHIIKVLSLNVVVLEGEGSTFMDFYHKFDYVLVRGLKVKKDMFPFLKDNGNLIHIGKTRVNANAIKGFICQDKAIDGVKFLWCRFS